MYQSNVFSPELQPMTLGSPPSGSSAVHQPPPSPYLPGFLLGDRNQRASASPGSRVHHMSPSHQHRNLSGLPATPTLTQHGDLYNSKGTKDTVGAPPIRRLAGEISGTPTQFSHNTSSTSTKHVTFNTPVQNLQTPRSVSTTPAPPTSGLSQSINLSAQLGDISSVAPSSPTQIDPFYTQGENLISVESLDETAVTIFGFAPSAASYILQQFSHYGTIVKHEISSQGNWMHVKYQSKLQAKKALSKNGKIFGDSIMIGVTPCIDKSMSCSENAPRIQTLSHSQQEINEEFLAPKGTPTVIRPLNAALQAARNEYEVVPSGPVAQKSTNFVSKAMEFVLGW